MTLKTRMISLSIMVLAAGLVLTACGSSSLRIGWRETSGFSRKTARYVTFDGVEKKNIRLQSGETLHMEWNAAVEKGSLTLEIQDPDQHTLWKESFTADDRGSIDLNVEKNGLYTLRIQGGSTGGGYELDWEIQ